MKAWELTRDLLRQTQPVVRTAEEQTWDASELMKGLDFGVALFWKSNVPGSAAPENLIPNIEVGRALQSEIPEETRRQFLAGKTAAQLREAAPDNLASLTGFFERQPTVVTAALLTTISVDGTGVSAKQAAALGVPCRVIAQARDKVHPLALAQELAASIPGADFVEITPKAVYKAAYARDLRAAIASFLEILR